MDYNCNIENRQISINTIDKVANYIEDLKESYNKKFEIDSRKNKNLEYSKKKYEYGKGNSKLIYEIEYKNGENIKKESYNWLISNYNRTKEIKYIGIRFEVSFERTEQNSHFDDEVTNTYHYISINIKLEENRVSIFANTNKSEDDTNNIFNSVVNMFKDNEERVNNTIKHRSIRKFCFCTTVGLIVSYIILILLKINENMFSEAIINLLSNKIFIVLLQWIIAIGFGQIISGWYITNLYMPIAPKMYYAGNKKYKDNLEFFIKESEVHIGKYWDAENRRKKIERIYKVCNKIVIVQAVISLIFIIFYNN